MPNGWIPGERRKRELEKHEIKRGAFGLKNWNGFLVKATIDQNFERRKDCMGRE